MKYQNIAAVWKKKDKNGKTYLSFKAERDIKRGESFNLFENDKGDNPSRPDFRAYNKIENEPQEPEMQPNQTSDEVASDLPF